MTKPEFLKFLRQWKVYPSQHWDDYVVHYEKASTHALYWSGRPVYTYGSATVGTIDRIKKLVPKATGRQAVAQFARVAGTNLKLSDL